MPNNIRRGWATRGIKLWAALFAGASLVFSIVIAPPVANATKVKPIPPCASGFNGHSTDDTCVLPSSANGWTLSGPPTSLPVSSSFCPTWEKRQALGFWCSKPIIFTVSGSSDVPYGGAGPVYFGPGSQSGELLEPETVPSTAAGLIHCTIDPATHECVGTSSYGPVFLEGHAGEFDEVVFQTCSGFVAPSGTSCWPLELAVTPYPATASPTPSRKSPLRLNVKFTQNGKPVVFSAKGQPPQKDTIQLADDDKGEIAQQVDAALTVTNTSTKTQTNVHVNGLPSFAYADATNARQALPIGITAGPTPSANIGTLAPGQKSTPINYVLTVTNNGVFDCSAQVLSTAQGSNHTLVSQGTVKFTALPTALLWLALKQVGGKGPVTAGTQVTISGTITNRSLTQSIDVDPIVPEISGNAGGGALVDSSQAPLSDGVVLPFAGMLTPGQSVSVEGYVQTTYVPSTRATVTYDPTGSVENAKGTETDLTPTQIGLSTGSSPINIAVNATAAAPPDVENAVVDNFSDAVVKGTTAWALNGLAGGLDLLSHPVQSASNLAKGVATFVVGSGQAVADAASLVSSLYLMEIAAYDMTPAQMTAWSDQLTADFEKSHLKIAANLAQSVYAKVNATTLLYLTTFADAYKTGNYNALATLLGGGVATGLTSAEDLMLGDLFFQKFAIGLKYTGQKVTIAAAAQIRSNAAVAINEGGLANLVSLEAAIRDAKATPVLGKGIKGVEAGTNLLADGAVQLWKGFGLTPRQISELQRYCERSNIIVAVRARSAKAAQLIRDGLAVGKNEILKIKNVNEYDVQFLGYSPANINTVVWAKPLTKAEVISSPAFKSADAATQEIVLTRLKLRTKEWNDPAIRTLLNTSEASGEISWGFNGADNGVPAANRAEHRSFELGRSYNPVKAGGKDRTYQQILVGNKPGGRGIGRPVPVTQDVDLMAITAANGEILSAEDRLKAYIHLSDIIGIEHPETPTFIKDGEFLFESKVKYLVDVTPGGEPLAIFSPSGAVTAGYFNPALTIFDTATHEGRIFFEGAYNDPYSTLKTKVALALKGLGT